MINLNKAISTPLALIIIIGFGILVVGSILGYQYYYLPEQEAETSIVQAPKTETPATESSTTVPRTEKEKIAYELFSEHLNLYLSKEVPLEDRLLDYKINKILIDIEKEECFGFIVEFSVKTAIAPIQDNLIKSNWVAGNGEVFGNWVKNKSLVVDVIKQGNDYIIREIVGTARGELDCTGPVIYEPTTETPKTEKPKDETAEWNIYTRNGYWGDRCSIKYPDTWEVKYEESINVSYLAPKKKRIPEDIWVTINCFPKKSSYMEDIGKRLIPFCQKGKFNLSSTQKFEAIYTKEFCTLSNDGSQIGIVQFQVRNGRQETDSYISDNEFEPEFKDFLKMLSTFKFISSSEQEDESVNNTCKPKCDVIGSKSEGWYDSCTNKLLKDARCQGCEAVWRGKGTSEGWYDSCLLETVDNELEAAIKLIKYAYYYKDSMYDEHDCAVYTGYTWCEAKQKCLRVWEEGCGITNQPSTENIPQDKETCEARKGRWGQFALTEGEQCILPTSDAGKICSSSKECEGMCIAGLSEEEKHRIINEEKVIKTTGRCSFWDHDYGLIDFVENGKLFMVWVD